LIITDGDRPSQVVEWLRRNSWIKTLNVAGNPESKFPGIGDRVERFLAEVFRQLESSFCGPP
jgi:hypothetical protein